MKTFVNLLTGDTIARYEFVNGWMVIVTSNGGKDINVTILEVSIFNALMNNDCAAFKRNRYSTAAMKKRGDYITDIHDDNDLIAILANVAARSTANGTVDASEMLNKVLKK